MSDLLLFDAGRGASGPAFPLLDQLVAYYSLEENNQTRQDAHTGDLDLTQTPGSSPNAVGKVGSAALFGGNLLRRSGGAAFQPDGSAFTWAFWIYLVDVQQSYVGDVLVKMVSNNTDRGFGIIVDSSFAANYIGSDSLGSEGFFSPTFNFDQWYFIAIQYDPDTMAVTGRINADATEWEILIDIDPAFYFADFAGDNSRFNVGGWEGGGDRSINARVDELGFWKKKLTLSHLVWLYNGGNGRSYAEIAAYTG